MSSGPRRATARLARWARPVAAALAGLAWAYPYAWLLATSLKSDPDQAARPGALVPAPPTLAAYREVAELLPLGRYLAITVFVATAVATTQVVLALPAGYALAKKRFAGRGAVFGFVSACLLVPPHVTFVPVFLGLARVGLVDTLAALVVPFASSALATFLVRQAMLRVPDAVVEAARLDGAGELAIVYRVLAPMVRPTLVAAFLLAFVARFGDYFWPLVMTTDESVRTLPLGVALLKEPASGVRWPLVMAGSVVLTAPVLVLFALAQGAFTRGASGPGQGARNGS